MTLHRSMRATVVVAAACAVGLSLAAPAMAASGANPTARTRATQTLTVQPPTNLRVDRVTTNSVTFEWSSSGQVPSSAPNCPLQVFRYDIFVNGSLLGEPYPGSSVGLVAPLQSHTTYQLAVRAVDNCSNATSPLSAPLTVTTL